MGERREYITPTYQSFLSWQTEDIMKHAYNAASEGNLETLSYCLAVLSPKHRNGTLTEWLDVIEYAQTLGMEPISWLEKAADVTALFNPKTSGKHNIYIILLSGLKGKIPGYGLYVGETSKAPADRFNEHVTGKQNRKGPLYSRIVHKHYERLLPTLYSHLNPMSREEAKVLEKEIAEALRLEGIPAYGGH